MHQWHQHLGILHRSARIVDWAVEELVGMDSTRKILATNICTTVLAEEGRRKELISIEQCVRKEEITNNGCFKLFEGEYPELSGEEARKTGRRKP